MYAPMSIRSSHMTQGRVLEQFAKRALERASTARSMYLAFDRGVARWSEEEVNAFAHGVYKSCVEVLAEVRQQTMDGADELDSKAVLDLQRALQDAHAIGDAILQQEIAPLKDCSEEEARQRQLQWAGWPPDIRLTLGSP